MRAIAYASAAWLVLLAGCERGTPEATTNNIEVPAGDYQAKLEAMPEGQRNAVFIRAIRDAGLDCQHVASSTGAGEINGAPAWTVACDNDVRWTVAIGGDGVAQVISTDELNALAAKKGSL